MARLLFSRQFVDDAAAASSPRVRDHLRRVLAMIERFPVSGSTDLPASIREQFGPAVRKCAVNPFDLVYRYDQERDAVLLEGLVSQRMAR